MTVEESKTGIVGNEVNLHLLVSAEHGYVLHDARSFRSCQIRELKTVAMKMYRMNIITGVAHPKAISDSTTLSIEFSCTHILAIVSLAFSSRLLPRVARSVGLSQNDLR